MKVKATSYSLVIYITRKELKEAFTNETAYHAFRTKLLEITSTTSLEYVKGIKIVLEEADNES